MTWVFLCLSLLACPASAAGPQSMAAAASFTVGDVREWAEDNGYTAAHCDEVSVEEAIGYACQTTDGAKASDKWSTAFPDQYAVGCPRKLNGVADYGCEPYWEY